MRRDRRFPAAIHSVPAVRAAGNEWYSKGQPSRALPVDSQTEGAGGLGFARALFCRLGLFKGAGDVL